MENVREYLNIQSPDYKCYFMRQFFQVMQSVSLMLINSVAVETRIGGKKTLKFCALVSAPKSLHSSVELGEPFTSFQTAIACLTMRNDRVGFAQDGTADNVSGWWMLSGRAKVEESTVGWDGLYQAPQLQCLAPSGSYPESVMACFYLVPTIRPSKIPTFEPNQTISLICPSRSFVVNGW